MIKTQDLPSASTLAQDDTLVANVGGKTKKVPVSLLTTENIKTIQNAHKSETHSIPITGWATHALDGTTYYAYTVTLTNNFQPNHCSVSLAPTGTNTLPTTAEAEAYNRCFATLDGTTLRICAAAVPDVAFSINVTGVTEKKMLCRENIYAQLRGWAKARGCKIEHDAAMAYGIDIICD